MSKKKTLYIIICIIFLSIVLIGVQKYENIKNPHKAFEKDLNKLQEPNIVSPELSQEQEHIEQEKISQQQVEFSDSLKKM